MSLEGLWLKHTQAVFPTCAEEPTLSVLPVPEQDEAA